MQLNNKTHSSYIVRSIVLDHCSFSYDRTLHTSLSKAAKSEKIKNNLKIDLEKHIGEKQIHIIVSVSFTLFSDEKQNILEASIQMSGYFEMIGDGKELDIETFATINAPAIIFPFIREHLATLTTKAGIGPILLPPVNFTKLNPKPL